jgi:hypothetical protein
VIKGVGILLNLPYYYGRAGEQYAFFRIPKLLLTDERFAEVSTDAKLLYGLLLDRMELSYRNGWIDEQNKKQTPLRQADGGAFSGILQQKGLTPPNR